MSRQATFADTPSATSSQAARAGLSLFSTLDGPTIASAGPVAVPVSRSQRRESGKAKRTNGTSGRSGSISSKPAARKSSGVNKSHPQKLSALSLRLLSLSRFRGVKLHEQTPSPKSLCGQQVSTTGSVGSLVYEETWIQRITPCGLKYWEHTASARRPSGSESSGERAGYPTATVNDATGSQYAYSQGNHEKPTLKLPGVAAMAGYPAPDASSGSGGRVSSCPEKRVRKSGTKKALTVNEVAQMAIPCGWTSPSARDWKDTPGMSETGINPDGTERSRTDQLPRQAALAPTPATGSTSATARRGRLNPALSAWLMSFHSSWLMAAPVLPAKAGRKSSKSSGTQSSPKSGRRSSKHTSKQPEQTNDH